MKLNRFFVLSLLVTGVLFSAGWGVHLAKVRSSFTNESVLTMSGTSSLHDWECKAGEIKGFVEHESAGKLKVSNVQVTVPVKSFDCGVKTMNNRLGYELKVEQYPNIEYRFKSVKEGGASGAVTKLQAAGTVTVRGAAKPVTFVVNAQRLANGSVRFEGSVPMKMTDFGIKPPALLGMNTGDDVMVKFNVIAAPAPGPATK